MRKAYRCGKHTLRTTYLKRKWHFSAPAPCIEKNADEVCELVLSSAEAEDEKRKPKMYGTKGFCNETCCGCVGCTAQDQGVEKNLEVLWGAEGERLWFEELREGERVLR